MYYLSQNDLLVYIFLMMYSISFLDCEFDLIGLNKNYVRM